MSTPHSRQTAVILPFNGRSKSGARTAPGASEQGSVKDAAPPVTFGSGWYHEAAIREADQDRKR